MKTTRNLSYHPTGILPQDKDAAKLVFGEKVRSLMNGLSMNQSDLGRASGLKRAAISTYIRGEVWPDPQNLRKLANALHVTPGELVPSMSDIEDMKKTMPARPPRTGSSNPALFSMEEVAPGSFRLRFDRVVSLETAMEILAIINRPAPEA